MSRLVQRYLIGLLALGLTAGALWYHQERSTRAERSEALAVLEESIHQQTAVVALEAVVPPSNDLARDLETLARWGREIGYPRGQLEEARARWAGEWSGAEALRLASLEKEVAEFEDRMHAARKRHVDAARRAASAETPRAWLVRTPEFAESLEALRRNADDLAAWTLQSDLRSGLEAIRDWVGQVQAELDRIESEFDQVLASARLAVRAEGDLGRVSGAVLLWDVEAKTFHPMHQRLPPARRALDPAAPFAVVLVRREVESAGQYVGGGGAFRVLLRVDAFRVPDGTPLGSRMLRGADPPDTIPPGRVGRGPEPSLDPVVRELLGS